LHIATTCRLVIYDCVLLFTTVSAACCCGTGLASRVVSHTDVGENGQQRSTGTYTWMYVLCFLSVS